MSEKTFKVSVQGPGISIERDVAQALIPRLVAILMADASVDAAAAEPPNARHQSQDTTIGEFLSELNISSNPERIAGITLFAREILGRERVPRDEIPEWFQRAGEAAPKNLFRDIKNAVSQRLIAEDHARAGEFLVTATGEKVLRRQGGAQSPTGRNNSAKRTRSSGTAKKAAAPASDGPMAKIQELIDEDWFAAPRTVNDLLGELAARGTHYKTGNVTLQMQTMVKEKKLRRHKKLSDGGKKEVWHYSNW